MRVEIIVGARAANRTVLQDALRELERGHVLVVAKLDRLSRRVVDAGKLLAKAALAVKKARGWTPPPCPPRRLSWDRALTTPQETLASCAPGSVRSGF